MRAQDNAWARYTTADERELGLPDFVSTVPESNSAILMTAAVRPSVARAATHRHARPVAPRGRLLRHLPRRQRLAPVALRPLHRDAALRRGLHFRALVRITPPAAF